MKIARHSCGPDYKCQFEWAEDCFVQCGGSEKYGFFFESFPRTPDTFIRGDSKISLEDAEKKCWDKLQKYNSCDLDHTDLNNFDKKNYDNGAGFCKKCGFFGSEIFPPWEECFNCKHKTFYSRDKFGMRWCENCYDDMPEDKMTESIKRMKKLTKEMEENPISQEEFLKNP